MARPITLDNASSTQTENPGRTVARTFVQTWLVPTILILLAAPELLNAAFDVVEDHGGTVPGWLIAAAAALTTGIAVVSTLAARIMAIPGVERALRQTPGLRWLAASEWEPDIGHDGDDSEEYEEDDISGSTEGTEDLDETDDPGVTNLDAWELSLLAENEQDATPPPEGWEPRH